MIPRLSKSIDTITERSLPVGVLRVGIACLSAALASFVAPLALTAGWLLLAFLGEVWTWSASRPQRMRRALNDGERLNYFLSIIFMNLVWCGLAVLVWVQPFDAARIASIMLLAAQLLHAQAFAAFSRPMLLVVGGFPAVTLMGFALAAGIADPAHAVLLLGAASLLIAYVFATSLLNRERERKLTAAIAAADEANRTKSLYMSMLSHELRTPLTGLLGMLESIRLGAANVSGASSIRVMDESGRAMMRMLDDMLDAAKQEAGTLEMDLRPVDLSALAASVRNLWSARAAEKGVDFAVELDAGLPPLVRGDAERIMQLINNLVSNALKFTLHGDVVVTIRRRQDQLVIAVSDTGPGLSADECERLFQPFAQAGARASRRSGAGLGLYVCRKLAEGMGGAITLASAPGQGATFEVALPLVAEKSLAVGTAPAADVSGLVVLVVDDHPVNRLVLQTMLEAIGCRVRTAAATPEALARARDEAFDVFLIDIHLADNDGRDLLALLRASGGFRAGARAIAFTADLSSETLASLPEAGFHGVLAKPVVVEQLVAAMAGAGKAGP